MSGSFTLYELQRIIGAAVEQFLPNPVWVSAEISELKVNYSGHCYLELVEKEQNSSSGGAVKAQVRAVIWKSQYPRLAAKFEAATARKLAASLKVLVQVTVTHHPVFGLSLQITDIDPTYTLGEVELQRQRTIAQLKADGVWDMNREQTIPRVIQRVAVISSATAAGYRDFMEEIAASPYKISTTLFEAVMQGEASEQSIVCALNAIAERCDEFDVVAIIRGGGSQADLECFNSYLTALYIAQFPLPVTTGIGHDKDTSIADMVAAIPLKTPTAVAQWICATVERFDSELEYAAVMLRESCLKFSQRAALRVEQLEEKLQQYTKLALVRQGEKLNNYAMLIENFAPARLLQLGFAVARSNGGTIRTIDNVEIGDNITIEVADGEISATIVNKYGKKG